MIKVEHSARVIKESKTEGNKVPLFKKCRIGKLFFGPNP